jgi:hypothetical protein
MKTAIKFLILFCAVAVCQTPVPAPANVQGIACKKGEYLTVNGRCLHDQTGESHTAGDGCNTSRCMDPACRMITTTSMYCSHGDDPAILAVPVEPRAPEIVAGTGITTAILIDDPPCGRDYPATLGKDGVCRGVANLHFGPAEASCRFVTSKGGTILQIICTWKAKKASKP